MPLSFHKMHANGDDFVIVDEREVAYPMTSALVRRLGDRRRGIGFNQLVQVRHCEDAAAQLVFWNADGSPLNVCGSATRGVADRLMRESSVTSITLRTAQGLLACERTSADTISVSMGAPRFDWPDIPLAQALDTTVLPLAGDPAACSMGNPHCTYFVDDLSAVDVTAIGPGIEANPLFPLKTNVHFVQIIDRTHIRLRIWERGGGIPQGSGSCACGAAVNGMRRGLLDNTVEVECDGGTVMVQWDGTGPVYLSGPVEAVFSGTVPDRLLHL